MLASPVNPVNILTELLLDSILKQIYHPSAVDPDAHGGHFPASDEPRLLAVVPRDVSRPLR